MIAHNSGLLYSTPQVVPESKLSELDMLAIATQRYPKKIYITLKYWMIIDIIVTESELKEITQTNKYPTVVYYFLTNSTPSEIPLENNQSYSDYQISYNDGFFETEETVYLLMGKGFRKTANVRLVSLLRHRPL